LFAHLVSLLLLAFAVSLDGMGVGVTYGLRRIRIPLLSIIIISLCSGTVVWLSMQVGAWLARFMSPDVAGWIGAVILILIGCWTVRQYIHNRREKAGHSDKELGDSGAKQQSGSAEEWNREAQSRIVVTDQEQKQGQKQGQNQEQNRELRQVQNRILYHDQKQEMHQEMKQELSHEQNREQNLGLEQVQEKLAEPKPTAIMRLELKRLGLVIEILRRPQIADVDRSGIITASEAVLLGCALSLDSFGAGLGAAMVGFSPFITALVIAVSSGLFLLGGMKLGFRFSTWRAMQTLSILPGIMLIVMGILKLI